MTKYIPIPVIESSMYLFGGHTRTVPGGWHFFPQKHKAFELMCVLEGKQTTKFENDMDVECGPGDIIIISPETKHNNFNSSETEDLTYLCFHFNIESMKVKSDIIRNISNTRIPSYKVLAKSAIATGKGMIQCSESTDLLHDEKKIRIEVIFLKFLLTLIQEIPKYDSHKDAKYTESEAKTARSMATKIESLVDNSSTYTNRSETIADMCKSLNISTGYGYRVFRKVYGTTPLHFMEEQRYRKAKLLLGIPEYSVEQIAYETGFNSLSNFSKQFKKWSGIAPSKYQQQQVKNRQVRSIKDSPFFE